jgi:hypothetical protein
MIEAHPTHPDARTSVAILCNPLLIIAFYYTLLATFADECGASARDGADPGWQRPRGPCHDPVRLALSGVPKQ